MAGIVDIPRTTLTVGTHDFGPATIDDADTLAVLTIDRTVNKGFNSKTSATTCEISIYQSDDGGSTWNQLVSDGLVGGITTNPRIGQINSNDVGVTFWPGTGRQARAEVVIGGTSVTVQGTLTIS